jgi:trimethylamine:corrinoid methyltransferase-like protein
VTNRLRLSLLTEGEVSEIYDKCLDLLSNKGIKIEHHPHIFEILKKAGAQVDFDNEQVRFPKDIIKAALASVPRGFTMGSRNVGRRNGSHDIILPHPKGLFYTRSVTAAMDYLDPDSNTYRGTMLADVAHWGQLIEALDEIDMCCFPTPRDAPEQTADIHALKTLFENTSKNVQVQPFCLESAEYLLELALVASGSTEAFKKRPVVNMISVSTPPQVIKAMDAEIIIQSCRYGAPITAGPLPSTGGTSPVTIAGTVMQSGMEILAILVISQLIEPGTPVIGHPDFFSLDMSSGRTLGSSIESILGAAASAQFIKDAFHIPAHTWGLGSDSYLPDGQASIEKTLSGMIVSMAGIDMLAGAGQLDVAIAMSPIQLILDNNLVRVLKRAISGVTVDDDTLAWQEIMDTVPGGHFLERAHTLKHCREALRTELFVSQPREVWSAEGSKDLYARAVENYKELKKQLRPQQLPEEVQRELNAIVKKADECLAK